jgi:outer membrane protein assembly factor BamB
MADRDPFDAELRRLLRGKDRPVTPSPAFSESLQAKLTAELGFGSRRLESEHNEMQASSIPMPDQNSIFRIGRTSKKRAVISAVGLAAVVAVLILGLRLLSIDDALQPVAAPSVSTNAPLAIAAASPSLVIARDSVAMVDANPGRTGQVDLDGPRDVGNPLWSTDGTGVAPPAFQAIVSGSTIYQVRPAVNGEDAGGKVGFLEAFDLASGARIWSAPIDFAGTPLVWNDLVLVPVSATSKRAGSAGEAAIAAFDAQTGSPAWTTQLPGSTYSYGFLDLIAANGVVFGGGANGLVSALDAGSGKLLWQSSEGLYTQPLDEGHPFPNEPAEATYDDGALYEVTPAGDLLALDAADGHLLWSLNITDKFSISSAATQLIATKAGLLLLTADKSSGVPWTVTDSSWTLLDPKTGAATRNGQLTDRFEGAIVIDRTLFILLRANENASLVKLNLATGEAAATKDLSDNPEVIGMSGSGNGRLYVNSATGTIAVLSTKDLKTLSSFDAETSLSNAPLIANGTIVVQKHDQGMMALGPAAPAVATPTAQSAAMSNGDPAQTGESLDPGPSKLTAMSSLDLATEYDTPNGTLRVGGDLGGAVALDGTLYQLANIPTKEQPNDGSIATQIHLRAVDIASGQIKWEISPDNGGLDVEPFDNLIATQDAIVVPALLNTDSDHDGSEDEGLAALDPATSGVLWQVNLGSSSGVSSMPAPILVDGVVYVCAPDGRVFAIALATGHVNWESGSSVPATPTIEQSTLWQTPNRTGQIAFGDGHLYVVAQDGSVIALDPKDGSLLWRFDTRSQLQSGVDPMSIIAADGGVIVSANVVPVTGNHAVTKLIRLDADHGTIAWVKTVDSFPEWLVLSGNTLILSTTQGTDYESVLIDYDAATGDQTAAVSLGTGDGANPVGYALIGGRLLIAKRNGTIAILDPSSLKTLDHYDTGQTLDGPIVATGKYLLVGISGSILVVSGDGG